MESLFFFFWIVMIATATMIGSGKGRGGLGFVLGFLLGLIGVIVIACLDPVAPPVPTAAPPPGAYPYPAGLRPCPYCQAWLRVSDPACPICHRHLGGK
jgi:hypothetical protein